MGVPKIVIISCILLLIFTGIFLLLNDSENAKLLHKKYGKKQVDNFILHTQIKRVDNGIQVYSSLQYVGEDMIKVQSNNPFVSMSFNHMNHTISLD